MNDLAANVVGTLAALCSITSFAPQIIKIWKSRDASSVSLKTYSLTVTCFVLAAVSGFALFHPALFWLTALVGGPQWARILHPYLGLAMFVLFLGMFFMFVGANLWRDEDSAWLESAGKMVSEGNQAVMPPVT